MRGSRTLALGAILLASALGIAAGADSGAERLFVARFPLDATGPGTIQAFDIDNDGIPVAAESYPTLGEGDAIRTPLDIELARGGAFLYATNNVSGSVVEYRVLVGGMLEPVPGTPLATDDVPIDLSAHPDEPILYAIVGPRIVTYAIGTDGALSELHRTGELSTPATLDVAPDGGFLYVASAFGPDAGIVVFELAPDGAVVTRLTSPGGFERDRPWVVCAGPTGASVYLLDLDAGLTAFSVGPFGELSPIDQISWDAFTLEMTITADGAFVYVGEGYEPSIHGLAVDASGAPAELASSPYASEPGAVAELLAPPGTSRLVQVTRESARIRVFEIGSAGDLAPLGGTIQLTGSDLPVAAAWLGPADLAREMEIDIHPGSDRNPVNPKSRGVVPVAILGSDTLDVANVDPRSCRFGPAEAAPAHRGHVAYLDGDDRADLVLHFRTQQTGIAYEDSEATLTCTLRDGTRVRGTDRIGHSRS